MLCSTPREALLELRRRMPGSLRIYAPGCSGEALSFAHAFADDTALAADATFLGVWIPGANHTDYAALHQTASSELVFLAPEFRDTFTRGRAAFHPLSYTQAWRWITETPLDAALFQVTPPDRRGMVSLGVCADFSPAALVRPDIIKVAHINPLMPRPAATPAYPLEDFDITVEAPAEVLAYKPAAPAPVFDEIARHVASMVGDGDTLQFGLGNVQLSVLRALSAKRRLRIHSGMISDPLLGAIDAGAIAPDEGAIVAGVALGTEPLYARAASDRRFRFEPVGYTHAHATLAAIPNFIAINSVIDVDLFGQANGEFIHGRQISGGGGLVDFMRGAAASKGGKPIIALASTARGGASRIVPKLSSPAVTLARSDVAIVVTEYGVADLRERSIEARAMALIAIAHPDHRRQLAERWASIVKEL
jgi:acyl-CoA hydrolase